MQNKKDHLINPEGQDQHLDIEQHAAATRDATETLNGLMPEGILYGIIFFDPPKSATSYSRKGMQAFDDNYYYLSFEHSKWRRKALHSF